MMNHTQPTPTAHLSDSAPACSERAGRHPGSLEAEAQIRALLADDRAQDVGFYLDHFSQGERKELLTGKTLTRDAMPVNGIFGSPR